LKGDEFLRTLILFIMTIFILTSCTASSKNVDTFISVKKGKIDLSSVSLYSEKELIDLRGKWYFTSGQLLPPEMKVPSSKEQYIDVPKSWESIQSQSSIKDGKGFGTYRLQIRIHPDDVGKTLGVIVRPIASSYNLWINGQLMRTIGIVGKSVDTSIPKETVEYVHFIPTTDELSINIQVSNFQQRKGGIWDGIYLGSELAMQESINRNMIKEFTSAGALLMMGIFYLAFALFYLPERSTMYLGVLCILFGVRFFFLGEVLVTTWFHDFNWNWQVKMEYLIEITLIIAFSFYLRSMYPKEYSKWVFKLILIGELIIAFIVVLTSSGFFTKWMIIHATVAMCALFYVLCFVYPKAIKSKILGARSSAITLCIVFLALVNDTLYYLSIPYTTKDLLYAGFFLGLLSQMSVTIRRYVYLKQESDILAKRLTLYNQELEEKIVDRTSQLTESHRNNAQLMHNIAHDLRAPILLISERTKQLKNYVDSKGLPHISLIEQQSEWAIKLSRNLNDLASFQEEKMKFKPKQIMVPDLLRFVYKRSEPMIRGGGFIWYYKPLDELYESELSGVIVAVDMYLLERVFDNLITNSLKYTPQGHEIGITYSVGDSYLEIAIENETSFVNTEIINRMFDRLFTGNHTYTGSGIGLAVCKEIIHLHKGDINVLHDQKNKISIVITLPLTINSFDSV
jgi:signal transduction histidine kinase